MTGRLQGQVAIITGASRGIGAAIARGFAAQGARVVITSRRIEPLQAAADAINADHPGAVTPIACHNGDVAQIAQMVARAHDEVGLPQILVNNAGTNPYFGPMIHTEWSAWEKTFEVNLKGYFEAARQVATRLIAARQPGAIINISSILGQDAAPLQGVYGMTKAAVISMTRTLAVEWGHHHIRVNAIAPGVIDTKLAAVLTGSPELMTHYNQRTALGRTGRPEELVGAALFLACDDSSYLTGHTLNVDGGYAIG
jgi:NAD(P)-dependent dehydrogenase (short-subunit alcohol dehydrogenase family)